MKIQAESYQVGMESGFDPLCLAGVNEELRPTVLAWLELGGIGGLAASTEALNNIELYLVRVPFITNLENKKCYIGPDDMIITDVKNERYPCKKSVFENTYDLVEECN